MILNNFLNFCFLLNIFVLVWKYKFWYYINVFLIKIISVSGDFDIFSLCGFVCEMKI